MKEHLESHYQHFNQKPYILWECPRTGKILSIELNIEYLTHMSHYEFDQLLIQIQEYLENNKLIKKRKHGKKKN